jgi:hypothetical protein
MWPSQIFRHVTKIMGLMEGGGDYELMEMKRVLGVMGLMKGVGGLMKWAWMIELTAEIWLTGWTGMIKLIAGMWLMRWTGMIELKQVWADGVSVDDRDVSSDEGCVDGRADSKGVADGVDLDDRADSRDVADGEVGDVADGADMDDSADSKVGVVVDDGAVGSGQGLYERVGEACRSLSKRPKGGK